MHYYAFAALINFLTSIILCLFVWVQSKDRLGRSFSCFAFSVAFWSFFYLLWQLGDTRDDVYLYCRLLMVGASWIPATLVYYTYELTSIRIKKRMVGALFVLAIMFSIASMGNSIVKDIGPLAGFKYWPKAGFMLLPFLLYFFACVALAHRVMWKRSRKGVNYKQKMQIQYVFWGTLLGFAGGSTNFFLWYDIPIKPYANILVSLYVASAAYAIVRHQLLDIEVVVKKATVYGGLNLFTFALFVSVVLFGQKFFYDLMGLNFWAMMFLSTAIIVLSLKPMEQFLVHITDKYLFQRKFDYKLILMQFINEIVTELDLTKIIEGTEDLFNKTIRPTSLKFYLHDKGREMCLPFGEEFEGISDSASVVKTMREVKKVMYIYQGNYPSEILDYLKSNKIEIAIPLERQGAFMGFILMGKKKSDEHYNPDDLQVFNSLSTALATAIMNAKSNENLAKTKMLENLGSMADGMSHQFNNVFGVIATQLEMQKMLIQEVEGESRGRKIDEQVEQLRNTLHQTKQVMEKVIGDAHRGGGIARSVLILTRPQKAGFKMQNVTDSLESGIRAVRFRHNDFDQVMEVKTEIEESLPKTWINESLLANIYQIAIHNSYDAIAKRTNPEERGRLTIRIQLRKNDQHIVVELEDNGMGMEDNTLKAVNIGVPYVSTKGTASDKSGFGVGVHTLANYVKLLCGRHHFESEWGNGTKLIIDLPVMDKDDYDKRSQTAKLGA